MKNDITHSQESISKINEDYKIKYSTFENEYKTKYGQILKEVKGLLPNALTAGLSSAFSKKKADEETLLKSLKTTFYIGLGVLIFFGLIPFFVSIHYLQNGHQLEETIL